MYNESAKKATMKYRATNLKRVALDLPIQEYESIKAYCDANGESVTGFIRRIAKENIEK